MSLSTASQSNVNKAPKQFDAPKANKRDVQEIINWVKKSGKVDVWSIVMAFESFALAAAVKTGLVKEENGFVVVVKEEVEEVAPVVETIDQVITNCKASQDLSLQTHANVLEQCLGTDPWSLLIAEDEKELERQKAELVEYHKQLGLAGAVLTIEGLSCKNLDRPSDPYWCFLGSEQACLLAQQVLIHEHLIRDAFVTPHSKNGEKWKLTVKPRIITGYIETSHLRELVEKVA